MRTSKTPVLLALTAALAFPAFAQDAPAAPASATQDATPAQTPAPATADATLTNKKASRKKVSKDDKVVQTKDTKREVKKVDKYNALLGKDEQLPDKQLYDKALSQEKSGHFDIARLDLQTLLNTYPDSQYQMRAKLAVADCWYREGGTAALTQAEQEYKDFITFFPNAPEAPEAQMRVGDIYFKQMDVPDRDFAKAMHAEEEYRNVMKQYPDAPKDIIDQSRQKLREVQEMLATREAELGQFYGSHNNWAAAIARYQTVVDTYPQYSHMDDTLLGIGDAYEAEANSVRAQATCAPKPPFTPGCLPEGPKAHLEESFDGKAAAAYRKVVLEHSAAPHAEDAKERLASMNLPIPVPTAEQAAASQALEESRAQYTITKRLELLFLHKPDTVTAARAGDPPLEDPAATTAPSVMKDLKDTYAVAFNPAAAQPAVPATTAAPATPTSTDTPAQPTNQPAAPLAFSDIAPGQGTADPSVGTVTSAPEESGNGTGVRHTGVGVEVLTPGITTRSATAVDTPAATGARDPNNGLTAVGPKNNTDLPAVEKPEAAPDQVNDLSGVKQPTQTATQPANGKKPKAPTVDKNDESSSKKKPKKGLDKVNPF